jgi:hypothetical protein
VKRLRPTSGILALLVLCVAFLGGRAAAAEDDLPPPTGHVILTVTGAIARTNGDGKAQFDAALLESLGTARLVTSTPWTEGRPVFEGVPMRALVERLGAEGKTATVVALNDYRMQIPVADFLQYPVLLASKMNGNTLRIRDKGPLWLIYPQDDFAELRNKPTQAKWVWQIKEIRFE